MATYILLMTLTPEGQAMALEDPNYLLAVEEEIRLPGAHALGVYAVLGNYDFVTIVEADNNEAIAGFSIQLGVKAGVHVTTLPAVPIANIHASGGDTGAGRAGTRVPLPEETMISDDIRGPLRTNSLT